MEELIGFLIFLVLAAFSVLSKVREQRAEEERRAQRAREKAQEQLELPEATRRTLYGEGGPPVAQRRQEVPAAPPRFPMPGMEPVPTRAPLERQVSSEQVREIPTQPAGRKIPPRRAAEAGAPPTAQRPSTLDDLWREMQREVQRRIQPAPAPAPQPVTAAPRQAQPQRQQPQRRQRQQPRRPRPEEPAVQRRVQVEPTAPVAAPKRRAPAPRPRSTALFANLGDVRRAIMLREVLGPPRALEPWP